MTVETMNGHSPGPGRRMSAHSVEDIKRDSARLRGSLLDDVVRGSGDIDVLVISGHHGEGNVFFSDSLEKHEFLPIEELERVQVGEIAAVKRWRLAKSVVLVLVLIPGIGTVANGSRGWFVPHSPESGSMS